MYLSVQHLLSMLFIMASILFGLFAMFTLNKNNLAKSKLFASLVFVFLSLWSYGYGLSHSAPNEALALVCYQVGSIGYYSMFSVVMHYILYTTRPELLKKRVYIKYGLYLPILANVVVYGIPGSGWQLTYGMEWTPYGWIAMGSGVFFDHFYHAYYIAFLLVAFLLLLDWFIKHKSLRDIIAFASICGAIGLTIIGGVSVDIIRTKLLDNIQPNLGPFFAILPTSVILMRFEKDGFLDFYGQRSNMEILRSEAKEVLFKYIGLAFMAGGVFAFLMEYYLGGGDFPLALIFGLSIGLYGMFLRHILLSDYPDHKKDNLVCIIVALFIPFIMFFSVMGNSGTVWPVPVIFMIAFMLYNNNRMIIGVSISSLLTLSAIGWIVPYNEVVIDWVDHSLRLLLLVLFIIFAMIVNWFYLQKLKENQSQYKNLQLVSQVTSLFAQATLDEFERTFAICLEMIGKHFEVDRVYCFDIDEEKKAMTYSRGWWMSGVDGHVGSIANTPVAYYPWWMQQLRENGSIRINTLNEMPYSAVVEKRELEQQDVASTITVPMYRGNKILGFLGLAYEAQAYDWDVRTIDALKILANSLSDAQARYKAERQVHEMAYKDYLTGLPNRAAFFDGLKQALVLSERKGTLTLVGLLDLDDFKIINDTYGHDVGDKVLTVISQRIKANVRGSDMVCRFGGDEFLMFFYGVESLEDAHSIGREVCKSLEAPINLTHASVSITASLGLTFSRGGASDVEAIVHQADEAMYKAKKKGKNQFIIDQGVESLNERRVFLWQE